MCVTLAVSLYTIIWKTVVNCVHIQAYSHKTAEFASLGPLQLGYAVFIASRKSSFIILHLRLRATFKMNFTKDCRILYRGVGSKIMYSKSCVFPFH
jgi:hypothetical protein